MKVDVLPTFIKDLKKLKNENLYSQLKTFSFERLPATDQFIEIPNIKKIKGSFYRIRIGDYRIGIRYEQDKITLMRVLHRKEIYRYFP